MADKITEAQELIPPMQPGVDHSEHIAETRQIVAENAGVPVKEVTPPDVIAGNIVDAARTDFLKNVAGVEQPSNQVSRPQKTDSAEGLSDLKETLIAYMPGAGTEDSSKIRTVPNKEPLSLEEARKAKMNPQEEKKAA